MNYSFTEKKRIRKNFGKRKDAMPVPYLLKVQRESFKDFLQADVPPGERLNIGLQAAFNSAFPIASFNGDVEMQFDHYRIDPPKFDENECRQRGQNYAAPVRVKLRMVFYDRVESSADKDARTIKDVKENDDVYIGDIPLMTETGSFIINGTERVVVSQLHRSPGVFFDHDKGKTHSSGKQLYSCRIIPYWGNWLDFEFDAKDHLYMRIDRRKKIPATILLRALGIDEAAILDKFFERQRFVLFKNDKVKMNLEDPDRLNGLLINFPILNLKGDEVIPANTRITRAHIRKIRASKTKIYVMSDAILEGRSLADNIVDAKTGEIIALVNAQFDENGDLLAKLRTAGISEFDTIYYNDIDRGPYMSETLRIDGKPDERVARDLIYKMMRPGDPPTREASDNLFRNLFFSADRYDLSAVGRMKLNRKLNIDTPEGESVLSVDDIIGVMKVLIELKDGRGEVDDIDNLGNRRVRSVGELVENQFRSGLSRVSRAVRDKLSQPEIESQTPQDLINAKPVSAVIREFFRSSQLSQFMDQTNPLAEVTHKRRVTALGPGGLSRERAGFEVRDVHPTHYGRVCPIETPEGPNIGLINSLSVYAQINSYGFLETPYRKVARGVVTEDIEYLSAIEEGDYVIAPSNVSVGAGGRLAKELVHCRHGNEFTLTGSDQINYVDVAPAQIVSIATALIPFLEHDDANRALMGSNMQRQAVPTIKTETPLIGTGMEQTVGVESGATLRADRGGVIDAVDGARIVIRVNEDETSETDLGVDIRDLVKYRRSNQSTAINQRPLVQIGDVVKAGDILADGPATNIGELALGRNILVAFMAWSGYNFEDSIVISERLVQDEVYTTVHIEEWSVEARETRLGDEEITRDIPNVSEAALSKLDSSGIVFTGAEVNGGDVLVGKVSPKGDIQPSPEQKLLQAIFGEKVADVKDTSLKLPHGVRGTVIDVQVFSRDGVDKDKRLQAEWEELKLDSDEKGGNLSLADKYIRALERALAKSHDRELENVLSEIQRLKQDVADQKRIEEGAAYDRLSKLLIGQVVEGGPNKLKSGDAVTEEYLSGLRRFEWPKIRVRDDESARRFEQILAQIDTKRQMYDASLDDKVQKLVKAMSLSLPCESVSRCLSLSSADCSQATRWPGDTATRGSYRKSSRSRICPIFKTARRLISSSTRLAFLRA